MCMLKNIVKTIYMTNDNIDMMINIDDLGKH